MKSLFCTVGLFLALATGMSAEITPLKPGESVPPLTLRTADGADFSLNKALAEKPAVLIFYRGGWCPYCSLHLAALQKIEPQLVEAGWQILAISPDRPEKLAEAKQEEDDHYRLLSDSKMEAAKAFGLAFEVDAATREKYKEYGIDLEAASGEKHHLLPVPAVYLAGTDGIIRFAYSNPDYKVRLEPEKILRAVEQHSETAR